MPRRQAVATSVALPSGLSDFLKTLNFRTLWTSPTARGACAATAGVDAAKLAPAPADALAQLGHGLAAEVSNINPGAVRKDTLIQMGMALSAGEVLPADFATYTKVEMVAYFRALADSLISAKEPAPLLPAASEAAGGREREAAARAAEEAEKAARAKAAAASAGAAGGAAVVVGPEEEATRKAALEEKERAAKALADRESAARTAAAAASATNPIAPTPTPPVLAPFESRVHAYRTALLAMDTASQETLLKLVGVKRHASWPDTVMFHVGVAARLFLAEVGKGRETPVLFPSHLFRMVRRRAAPDATRAFFAA